MTRRCDSIGVGIVGLSARGHWAATAHLPALRALGDFEIRGLTASSLESACAAAEKYDVPFYCDDASELARRDDIDLVVVSVKVPAHREAVAAALNAGKMVYCEWPLGNGLEETRELARLAEERGVRGFIGLQGRSAPPVRYLRDLLAAGFVGEVRSTSLIAGAGAPWNGVVGQDSTYLLDERNGATMLTIPFGHTVDAMCQLLGRFVEVSATIARQRTSSRVAETGESIPMHAPDQVAVTGVLENGAVAAVHYRGALSRGNNFLWEINGTDGDLVVEGESGHLQYGRITIRGAKRKDKELTPLPVPDSYSQVQLAPRDYSYAVAHAYKSVADDIWAGTQQAPTFADALSMHTLLDAVERAARTGQRQTIW